MNTNKIAYNKYVAEIIGTLILVLVVALSGSQIVLIFSALAYAFIVYLFSDISDAHMNPAFTIAALTMKKIKWQDAVLYICAQLIGAGIALMILKNIPDYKFIDLTKDMPTLALSTIFKTEVIGAAIFALGFGAMIHGKTTRSNAGFVMGMALFFGLLFANMAGGIGLLNPAVAIGSNILNWATIIGPIVGAVIGAWIYRFIVLGNFCGCNSSCENTCGCGFCHKGSRNSNFQNSQTESVASQSNVASEPVVVVVEEIDVV